MSDKIIKTAGKAAATGGGALAGGAAGAAFGTMICPGIGTAVGYLTFTAIGVTGVLKLSKKWFG